MAYRTYRAIYSFVEKDASEVCIEEGDSLIVHRHPNGEWQDPMSEMTGTNTRTGTIVTFPGVCVELVSECIAGPVQESEPESNPPSQIPTEDISSFPCSNTETEEGIHNILSHQIPKNVDNNQTCIKLCMHGMEILKKYNGLEAGKGRFMNLVQDVEVLNKLIHQCETETITIGVVGGYNSGKSTLINGLLNCKYLPEAEKAETALPILIQHDPNIHYGMCNSDAQSCCTQCPRLVINGTEHIGQKNILSALSRENENARLMTPGADSQFDHQQMVLKANIPSLSCPPALKSGCKLHLVDNPGLGELNQIASRMAQLAVATSTAYIYTMDCESIELKEHAEIIKILLERDSDLIQSGRLVMVVTKCDRFYEREGALSGSKEQKWIMDLVCKTFESSLQVPVPCENVIPISGMWQSWIARYETLDSRTRKKVDYSAGIYIDTMDDCEKPKDVCAALKHGSNYASLEEKIASLAQNCLQFFETKMKTVTLGALEWAATQITPYKDALEKEINEQTENLKKVHERFDEMETHEQIIKNTLDGDQLSELEASLGIAFKVDIEQIKEEMSKDAQEKYAQFEIVCKEKGRNRYIVREFLTDFKSFLLDMNSHVMLKIRKQQYRAMYKLYSNAHKSLVSMFQELNTTASAVCHRVCMKTDLRDKSSLCQQQLITLSYDQISTVCVADQPIHRCNPQDSLNALLCLRGLAAFFSTHGSDGIYGDAAFPSISPKSMEDSEEIFTHRLKSREIVSLLNINRGVVERELKSFLEAIQSQFVGYFSGKLAKHGKAYLTDHNANWRVHLTAAKKDTETQKKEIIELNTSLQKISELSDYIQSLVQHIQ